MRVSYSHHLVGLVARVEAANTRLAAADPDRRAALAERSRRRAAALSARLDGSPLREDTVTEVDDGRVPSLDGAVPEGAGSGWVRAVRLESGEVQRLAAIEYHNLIGVAAIEDQLAELIHTDTRAALHALHQQIVGQLVDPDVIGQPRRTEQAVHDGAHGMVIYAAPPPDRAAEMMTELLDWLDRKVLTVHPAIVAGVVHERILQAQPFEAGNGRVARAATRLVLINRGIDPAGAAVLEEELIADAAAYYGEVAATIRRSDDLLPWLERHTGALARALERAADQLDPRPLPGLPERGRDVVASLPVSGMVNVRSYATDVGVDLRTARHDLEAFARAGVLAEVAGGHGLIFRKDQSAPDR
ncbi:Fic family protein [Euzebya tangerina]|uniref:Fic family protein n=1 Tax=Euzebya tangerina TaxID=591198 RepID=UPI000E318812|nr:Fic family protein [Euzebya tangerina]